MPDISPEINIPPLLNESLRKPHVSVLLVLGQGPVKPILLTEELSEQQKAQWDQFKTDPLKHAEPEFRVIEESAFLSQIADIKNKHLSQEDERQQIDALRLSWQHTGRLALNRWGRENALAAGVALIAGLTDKVILTGGKTKPEWLDNAPTVPQFLKNNWVSEAVLMRDVILARFGRKLSDRIVMEDASTNTIENLTNIIDANPDLENVGLLTANFHLTRVRKLADLFGVRTRSNAYYNAQKLLRERATIWNKQSYIDILDYMSDSNKNADLMYRLLMEDQWIGALENPESLRHWLGYVVRLKDLSLVQKIFQRLNTEEWAQSARIHFAKVGLDFDEYANLDLEEAARTDPSKITALIEQLSLFQKGKPGNLRYDPQAPPYIRKSALTPEEIKKLLV